MVNNIQDRLQSEINGVAEVHFYIKYEIEKSLKNRIISPDPEVRAIVGEYDTYLDRWRATAADKFFDMSTMIRLGTAIQICLRNYYMYRKRHSTLIDLRKDPRYEKNIFQRVQDWQQSNVISLYSDEIGYDLTTNPRRP